MWEVFNNCKYSWVVEQNPKQLKNMLLNDLSPNKIKAVLSNLIIILITQINKSYWMQQFVYDFSSS